MKDVYSYDLSNINDHTLLLNISDMLKSYATLNNKYFTVTDTTIECYDIVVMEELLGILQFSKINELSYTRTYRSSLCYDILINVIYYDNRHVLVLDKLLDL